MIFGSCKVGGTRRDIASDTLARIMRELNSMAKEIKEITDVFINDSTVKHRMVGVGVLSKQDALMLGAVGPTARGSDVAFDTRKLGYAAYKHLAFDPITETAGDSHSRCVVRIKELFQSIDLIRQSIDKIPAGPIAVEVKGTPNGEYFARTEQPRGEVIYYIKGDGTKFLQRMRVRTPTFANIPPIVKVLPGHSIADVPILVLTIDPCISCTER